MKQQKRIKSSHKPKPTLIDERSRAPEVNQDIQIDPKIANQPLRTVLFVEVGDMSPSHIKVLIDEINKNYSKAKGGIHYIIPIRNGKIGTDIMFEKEWLEVVHKTCTIQDGEIVLKDGIKECTIIRQHV